MPYLERSEHPDLFYERREGPEDRPGLVFFNGMTQTTQHWGRQSNLFGEDFRILRYDARGHGRTELGDHPVSMELHIADVVDLLDEVGWKSAHFTGFSHGSRVALGTAAHRPQRVEKLVLCSTTARPTALARTIVRSWREVLDAGGLEAMNWTALPAIIGNDYLAEHGSMIEGIVRASTDRNDEEEVRKLLDARAEYPEQADLARDVDAPTLVLSAEEDPLVTPEGARELAEIAGGEHREIDGVGHTIPIEAPQRFYRAVDGFLTSGN